LFAQLELLVVLHVRDDQALLIGVLLVRAVVIVVQNAREVETHHILYGRLVLVLVLLVGFIILCILLFKVKVEIEVFIRTRII